MDGNDFIQSFLTSERHLQFDREVEKHRLAKLAAPSARRNRVGALAWHTRALVRSHALRAVRMFPARDV